MVTARMNFDLHETELLEFGESHVISEWHRDETHINNFAGGIVGDDNLADIGVIYPEIDVSESMSTIVEYINNFELDRFHRRVMYAPGRVEHLSVSVALDGAFPAETVLRFQELIAVAVGADIQRGDHVLVMNMDFPINPELAEQRARTDMELRRIHQEELMRMYISYAFRILAMILGFVLLMVLLRAARNAFKKEPEVVEQPIPLAEMEDGIEIPKPKTEAMKAQEKAQKIASENPEETAALLKQWLMEE